MSYSSPQFTPFASDVEERVPLSAQVKKLSASSIVQERNRVRFSPSGATTYTLTQASTDTVNFIIQSGSALLDANSVCLNFSVTLSSTAGGDICLDDNALSVFSRATLSQNGQMMEDTPRIAAVSNSEQYHTISQSYYDTAGSAWGMWAKSASCNAAARDLSGPAGAVAIISTQRVTGKYSVLSPNAISATNDTATKAKIQAERTCGVAGSGIKTFYSVPLGLALHMFRTRQLVPLKFLGQLQVSLQLASLTQALVQAVTGAAGAVCVVSDLSITADLLTPHLAYAAVLERICMSEDSSEALTVVFDSVTVASVQQPGIPVVGALTTQSITVSRASPQLRSIWWFLQPQSGLALPNYPSNSCFSDFGLASAGSWQVRIGSVVSPSLPLQGAAQQLLVSKSAWGAPLSEVDGIIDRHAFQSTSKPDCTTAFGEGSQSYPLEGGCDAAVHALSFERWPGEALSLDGIDVGRASSGLISIDLQTMQKDASLGAFNCTVMMRCTRALRFTAGTVRVDG